MQNSVFVLDSARKPLTPCLPAVARRLLSSGQAAIFRRQPFTIILKRSVPVGPDDPRPIEAKYDPGSKITGIALVKGDEVIWAAELEHRSVAIRAGQRERAQYRRGRRNRKTRYRPARFDNRVRPKGWLAPSIAHRVRGIETWAARFRRWVPITGYAMEKVKFDMQRMENPDISGVDYQRGTLYQFEVMQFLLQRHEGKCAYCGTDTPKGSRPIWTRDHVVPRSRGGSDRPSNLVLSCYECNLDKGNKSLEEYLARNPARVKRIRALLKATLRDAAAVNSTRNAIQRSLESTGLPVRVGSGGMTAWNRKRFQLPKEHWVDAACVADVQSLRLRTHQALQIRCTGHGSRRVCNQSKKGFPISHRARQKRVHGLQTGDIVLATVKRRGWRDSRQIVARLDAARQSGAFSVKGASGEFSAPWHRCRLIQRSDGYDYSHTKRRDRGVRK